jgi:hypothetical protein
LGSNFGPISLFFFRNPPLTLVYYKTKLHPIVFFKASLRVTEPFIKAGAKALAELGRLIIWAVHVQVAYDRPA